MKCMLIPNRAKNEKKKQTLNLHCCLTVSTLMFSISKFVFPLLRSFAITYFYHVQCTHLLLAFTYNIYVECSFTHIEDIVCAL